MVLTQFVLEWSLTEYSIHYRQLFSQLTNNGSLVRFGTVHIYSDSYIGKIWSTRFCCIMFIFYFDIVFIIKIFKLYVWSVFLLWFFQWVSWQSIQFINLGLADFSLQLFPRHIFCQGVDCSPAHKMPYRRLCSARAKNWTARKNTSASSRVDEH
jgi:hypothetical protein